MGLAGVKKTTKIGIDPRNTKWINNENGVGHKLLAAQGWVPGQGLGDSMKGRTVNIKTTYKDDTSGIGCTPQHAQEWSGLGAFNDIFARINNEDLSSEVSDPGLKNPDRVVFMETKEKRIGLDVRFVKGETFTSELSKAKFLESLGVAVGTQPRVLTEKEQRKAKKSAKQARKLEKAAKREARAQKKSSKKNSSKTSKAPRDENSTETDQQSTSSPRKTRKAADAPAAVIIPPAEPSTRPVHGRFASRAKYQKAKLGSRMDAAQLAQILGVKA